MRKFGGAFAELDAGFCEGASSAGEVFKEKGFVIKKCCDVLPLSKPMARHLAGWRSRASVMESIRFKLESGRKNLTRSESTSKAAHLWAGTKWFDKIRENSALSPAFKFFTLSI